MTREDLKKELGVVERYGVEMIGLIMFAIVTWTGYTTYQNALMLIELKTSMNNYASTFSRMDDKLTQTLSDIKDHERRISRIEDTRWSEDDHRRFSDWLQSELNKKVDKPSK